MAITVCPGDNIFALNVVLKLTCFQNIWSQYCDIIKTFQKLLRQHLTTVFLQHKNSIVTMLWLGMVYSKYNLKYSTLKYRLNLNYFYHLTIA